MQPAYETLMQHGSYPRHEETPLRLILKAAPALEVLVTSKDGTPVPGATVEQYGLASPHGSKESPAEEGSGPWSRYAYSQQTTDAEGTALFPRGLGEQLLRATLGDLVSIPWQGTPGLRVVLELQESFQVGGDVTLPDWSALSYEGERRIRVVATTGGLNRNLAVLRHVVAGEWGPVRVPLLEDTTYSVHLEGSPIIPVRLSFGPPLQGERVRVDLDARLGRNLWLLVNDEDGQPIKNAEATLKWDEGGTQNRLTRRAGEDGYVNLWSVPEGAEVNIFASAPGFVAKEFPSRQLPATDEFLEVTLTRAGRLRGRCLAAGSPVPDFSVLAWSATDHWAFTKQQFRGREDGSFEMEGVHPGDVLVLASSESYPPSAPVAVHVTEGEESELEIRLEGGRVGRGVVVDAESQFPIEGARIRRVTTDGILAEDWWGSEVYSGADGSFEIVGLTGGNNIFEVMAPKHSREFLRVDGSRSEVRNDVRVELFKLQNLQLELFGLEDGSYSAIDASATDRGRVLPRRSFSADGHLTYEQVSPGSYEVRLLGAFGLDQSAGVFADLDLRPGRRWNYRLRVGGPNHLTVVFDPGQGGTSPGTPLVDVRYRGRDGLNLSFYGPLSASGIFQADGIDADSIWVQIFSSEGVNLAGAGGKFVDGRLALSIEGGKEPFHLLVTDGEGVPLQGVGVSTVDPVYSSLGAAANTNAEGVAVLVGIPSRRILVNLFHETNGIRIGAALDGSLGEATLVLEGDADLTLLVRSDGVPVSGVSAAFLTSGIQNLASVRRSNGDGVIRWSRISPGSYSVQLSHPGYWPQVLRTDAAEASVPVAVDLRALGTLVLHAQTKAGLPVPGLALELVDGTSKESVSEWLAKGLVSSGGSRTDVHGELRFESLPQGVYQVSTTADAAHTLGAVEVLGGEETVGVVVLADQ